MIVDLYIVFMKCVNNSRYFISHILEVPLEIYVDLLKPVKICPIVLARPKSIFPIEESFRGLNSKSVVEQVTRSGVAFMKSAIVWAFL